VLVDKSGTKMAYDINSSAIQETYPLQMGNGEYKVSVLENIDGDRYKYLSSENVTLALSLADRNKVYLASVQNINWSADMAAIRKARELTQNLTQAQSQSQAQSQALDQDKTKAIYDYIVNNIKFDYDKFNALPDHYIPNIDQILAMRKGICYDFASIFAAMLRSVGVPVKLIKGYSKNANGYHAWNEVYNKESSSWLTVDTTYDSQMKAMNIRYTMYKDSSQYTKVYEY